MDSWCDELWLRLAHLFDPARLAKIEAYRDRT